jgi:hypothetical protein
MDFDFEGERERVFQEYLNTTKDFMGYCNANNVKFDVGLEIIFSTLAQNYKVVLVDVLQKAIQAQPASEMCAKIFKVQSDILYKLLANSNKLEDLLD